MRALYFAGSRRSPYRDSEQLYACLKELFTRIEEQGAGAVEEVQASRLVIRLHLDGPEAEITINGRVRPAQITYGPDKLRPTLEIEMAASTLHHILLGEQSLRAALANGLLQVRGPIWKAMVLADLFRQGQKLYPDVLCAQGLG